MTYNQQAWVDGTTPISAQRLNTIEAGIAAAAAAADTANAGLKYWFNGTKSNAPFKLAAGTGSGVFNAISYVYVNADYSSAGFTGVPLVLTTPLDTGSSGLIVIHATAVTATGATLVVQATGNITTTIPINWIAIGT